jgi:hypothetical protein
MATSNPWEHCGGIDCRFLRDTSQICQCCCVDCCKCEGWEHDLKIIAAGHAVNPTEPREMAAELLAARAALAVAVEALRDIYNGKDADPYHAAGVALDAMGQGVAQGDNHGR